MPIFQANWGVVLRPFKSRNHAIGSASDIENRRVYGDSIVGSDGIEPAPPMMSMARIVKRQRRARFHPRRGSVVDTQRRVNEPMGVGDEHVVFAEEADELDSKRQPVDGEQWKI